MMNCIDVCAAVNCIFDEAALDAELRRRGYPELPSESADTSRYEVANEVALDELLGRLAPHHAAADIFLPVRFAAPFVLGKVRYGSVSTLLRALPTLRDELELEMPREERSPKLGKQRNLWRTLRLAAKEASTQRCCLAILRGI